MTLEGKVALVTGAGSGIGKAAAVRFAQAGANVGVLTHTADEAEATADQINAAGGRAVPLLADVAEAIQVEQAVAELVRAFGRLDVVYANAGINGVQAPIDELTVDEWDRTLNTNLRGTFLTIKYTVPHLRAAGGGSIVVTSSINGTRLFSNSGASAYATSKAGQVALVKMVALELARDKIRVNAICPGAIDTEIGDNSEKRNLSKIKYDVKLPVDVPLTGKPGSADQVAELALFLASDASSLITGTPVWIDGGQSLLQG